MRGDKVGLIISPLDHCKAKRRDTVSRLCEGYLRGLVGLDLSETIKTYRKRRVHVHKHGRKFKYIELKL